MSTIKHTPGPWFVGELESFEEVRRTVYEGNAFRNETVAVFKTPEQALLAAAAPKMLEALIEAKSEMRDWGPDHPVMRQIDNAIAAAT